MVLSVAMHDHPRCRRPEHPPAPAPAPAPAHRTPTPESPIPESPNPSSSRAELLSLEVCLTFFQECCHSLAHVAGCCEQSEQVRLEAQCIFGRAVVTVIYGFDGQCDCYGAVLDDLGGV